MALAVMAPSLEAQVTTPITNWWVRPNGQGVAAGATVTSGVDTNSPVFGTLGATDALGNPIDPSSATYGNADDVTIWAALPTPVTLVNGQEIVFSGQVTFDGVPVTGDTFRFGMYDGPNFTGDYDPNVVETPANLAGVPRMWKGFATRPAGGGAGVGYFDARNPASTNWANVGFTSTFGNPGSTFPLANVGTGPGQTQTPAELVIGLSQGPATTGNFGGAAPNNTYNFRITVGRFGFESTMSALIESTSASYRWTRSATASPNQDTVPSFLPDEFDRVGFLLSNGMNTDQAAYSDVNFTVRQIESLILDVNTVTGAMRIRNASGVPFDMTGYRITSAAGSLNFGNWTSLDDGEGGDPVGTGWDQSGGSGANALTELNLIGSRLMNNGDSFSLGNAFNTTGVTTQDLVFFFATAEGELVRGVLNYNTTSSTGAVPEPGALALAALAFAAVARRRRNCTPSPCGRGQG